MAVLPLIGVDASPTEHPISVQAALNTRSAQSGDAADVMTSVLPLSSDTAAGVRETPAMAAAGAKFCPACLRHRSIYAKWPLFAVSDSV